MSRTIVSMALAIFVALTAGCAVYRTDTIGADGSSSTTTTVRWVAPITPPVFYYGDYPVYYEHRHHYYVVAGRQVFLPPEIADRCVLRGGRCVRR